MSSESKTTMLIESKSNMLSESKSRCEHSLARRSFLRRAAIGAAAIPIAGLAAQPAMANPRIPDLRSAKRIFRDIREHENDHVMFLLAALGSNARPKPMFTDLEQDCFETFVLVAQTLENTGVGAYLAAAPVIQSREILANAGSIALIEARHAGWLNTFVGVPIAQNVKGEDQSFETPLTIDEVVALAGPFITSLNGGPPLTFSSTPSDANDIAILNFALALEFLEARYYNVNRFHFNS